MFSFSSFLFSSYFPLLSLSLPYKLISQLFILPPPYITPILSILLQSLIIASSSKTTELYLYTHQRFINLQPPQLITSPVTLFSVLSFLLILLFYCPCFYLYENTYVFQTLLCLQQNCQGFCIHVNIWFAIEFVIAKLYSHIRVQK